MARTEVKLEATPRSGTAQAIRTASNIPAVLYGHGLPSQNIEVNAKVFTKVFMQAGYSSVITLKLKDGKDHNVIIRELQQHPMDSKVTHIDFYEVRMDEAIRAKVTITLTGESEAVKTLGGVLVRNIDELDVSALPADLPHDITVDISVLDTLDKVIRVSDVKVPEGVTVHNEADDTVVSVQPPRSEQELEQLSEEVKEDVEAVEGVKKAEPVEGEEGEEGKTKDKAEAPEAKAKKDKE